LLWGSMMMPKTKLVVGNGILHASNFFWAYVLDR